MNQDLRTIRQKEWAEIFVNRDRGKFPYGAILYLCPRVGKCRVAIRVFEKVPDANILVAYPNTTIKASWVEEFKEMQYVNANLKFTTHMSLKKHVDKEWDLIVLDEIHLLSDAQISIVKKMNGTLLGLTGTMTGWTERELKRRLGLRVLATYPIEQAIKEGVITDYEIRVKKVQLDPAEKKKFGNISWVIEQMESGEKEGDPTFLRFARMRIIQASTAKTKATKTLLAEFKHERIIVFCGQTKVADALGCPVYHGQNKDKEMFEKFATGEGNHLAVVKLGNTGVTYKPLNKVIINYFDSNAENLAQKINRCMAMEYDNPDKKSIIYIISSAEEVEQRWLQKALDFFDESKIKYI